MTPLRLGFAGTPDFAALHLEALFHSGHDLRAVLTQPDRPRARGKQPQASPVKRCAAERGVPVLQPPSLRPREAQTALAELQLDALVVVAYGLILPQAVLDMPRLGCVNVHGSLLPRWRGAAPVQRAIEAGDARSGITIMQMDAGLDTGPMLARAGCEIDSAMTSGELFQRLAEIGPGLLLEVLADLPGHLSGATRQDEAQATYAAKISKEEACIDWNRPAAELAARVRAFNPAPGCYGLLNGERIKFWNARAITGGDADATAGTLLDSSARGIAVRCGDGTLLITELQMPGARAMPAAELLRGRGAGLRPGLRFDLA